MRESRKKICNDLGKGKSSTMKIIINVVHVLVLFPLFVCLSNEPPSDSPCLFVRVFCAFVPCSFVPEFAKLIFPTYCFKSSCCRSTRRAVSVWGEEDFASRTYNIVPTRPPGRCLYLYRFDNNPIDLSLIRAACYKDCF